SRRDPRDRGLPGRSHARPPSTVEVLVAPRGALAGARLDVDPASHELAARPAPRRPVLAGDAGRLPVGRGDARLASRGADRRARPRPRARRVLPGGRHPDPSNQPTSRAPGAAGARARPPGLRLVATSSPRTGYGQPPTTQSMAAPAPRPRTATNTGS